MNNTSVPPKVSIIIPCYNREKYIGAAIESALAQTYDSCEVVVVDDGSTDRSWTIIKGFEGNIRCIHTENRGVSSARNTGITAARGDYLVFLDSDDCLTSDAIESLLACATDDERRIVVGRRCAIDINGNFTQAIIDLPPHNEYEPLRRTFVLSCYPFNISCLIPRSLLLVAGGYDQSIMLSEDYDVNFRMALCGGYFFPINHLVYQLRHHPDERLTANPSVDAYRKMLKLLERTWLLLGDELAMPENDQDRIRLGQWCWGLGRRCFREGKCDVGDEFIILAQKIAGRDARVGHPVVRSAYNILHPRDVERALELIKALSSGFRKRIFLNDVG